MKTLQHENNFKIDGYIFEKSIFIDIEILKVSNQRVLRTIAGRWITLKILKIYNIYFPPKIKKIKKYKTVKIKNIKN